LPLHRNRPDPTAIRDAASILAASRKPVIIAGGGVIWSQAWTELIELAERYSIPVATTLTGKGTIPETHPLALGVTGSYTRVCALRTVREADTVLAIGTKLAEVATAAWSAPTKEASLIHLDIDPSAIGRNYHTQVSVVADAKLALIDLIEQLGKEHVIPKGDWAQEAKKNVTEWRTLVDRRMCSTATPIRPEYVMKTLREVMDPHDVLVSDASFSTAWTGAYFDVLSTGRAYISPRGAGGVGCGFPLALGAQCALPERRVFCVAGDAGFSMGCLELETALRLNLPVITIVLNNSSLGYIMHMQKAFFNERYISTMYGEVNFAKIAEGFGCYGTRVERPNDLSDAIKNAIDSHKPAVLDVTVDPWAYPPVLLFRKIRGNEDLNYFLNHTK